MTRTMVQTVLGPIPTSSLGTTFTHEHLLLCLAGYESDTSLKFDRTFFPG